MTTIKTPSIWIEKSSGQKVNVYKITESGAIMYDGLGKKNSAYWGGASPTLKIFLRHFIQPSSVQLDLFESVA